MPRTVTIESLAKATGYSTQAISNALFAVARMARERGCVVDEEQALRGLGDVLAFAAACGATHATPAEETTDDPPTGHEYP